MELVKREDRYDLYADDGSKMASTSNGKLSLKNCEAIANGYDLDELSKSEAIKISETEVRDEKLERIYKRGFQKALEILGDKKFSEEDIKNAIEYGIQSVLQAIPGVTSTQSILDAYKQALKQTEWDVEIVTEPMNLDEIREQGKGFLNSNTNKPKLDADGCLILKLKL